MITPNNEESNENENGHEINRGYIGVYRYAEACNYQQFEVYLFEVRCTRILRGI